MNDKAKWILFNIFDFGFTWVGSAAVIVYNCVTPDNSAKFKLTLGGISLIVALLCTAKAMYEKSYREKYDRYLQQLAEAVDTKVKAEISKKLNVHKQKNDIYQRAMLIMPFLVLYIVTYFGARSLESLSSTVGLILVSLCGGSVFNILKKPVGDRVALQKITKKAAK